jgi:hypothetical protein
VPTYTVHEPHPVAGDLDERATRLVFVKEGFSFIAFAVPVIWLLYNRLWLALLLFLLATAGVVMLVASAGGGSSAIGWAVAAVNLIFGFEARNVHRNMLARKGYEVIGVVTGRDLEDSERRFLTEWLPQIGSIGAKPAGPAPASSTPTSEPSSPPSSAAPPTGSSPPRTQGGETYPGAQVSGATAALGLLSGPSPMRG